MFIAALTVCDVTRSKAYIFPSIIIAFLIVKDTVDTKILKQLTAIVLFFCFIYPSYSFIVGKEPHPYNPMYLCFVKHLLHID